MESRVRMSLLRELYRSLLTPWQDQVLDLYYDQDWSLAEIAAVRAVSRAAVHSVLKRAEAILGHYEQKLGLLEKYQARSQLVDRLQQILDEQGLGHKEDIADILDQLRE